MKKLSNLKGAKVLSKKEQKTINGGAPGPGYCCDPNLNCCMPSYGTCKFRYSKPGEPCV